MDQASRARFIRWFDSGLVVFVRYLFLTLGIASFLILLLGVVLPIGNVLAGVCYFFLAPALFTESANLYVSYLRDHPAFLLPATLRTNPYNRTDFATQEVLRYWRKNPTVSGLIEGFSRCDESSEALLRLGITLNQLGEFTAQPWEESAIVSSLNQAAESLAADQVVSVFAFLRSTLLTAPLQPLLARLSLSPEAVTVVTEFYERRQQLRYQQRAFWLNRTVRSGGFAKDWAVSYTNLLDQFTSVVPPNVRQRALFLPIGQRQQLIDQIVFELNKGASQNVLLVGEEGVGKTELFYHFAADAMFYQTKTALDGQEVRVLNLQALFAQAPTAAQLQPLLNAVFAELIRAGNVILFIDPIDLLLSSQDKAGTADVSNVLESFLSSKQIHIIGAISEEQYLKLVKPNQLLAAEFSPIKVLAPSAVDLLPILLSHLARFENRYHVFFPVETLSEIVQLGTRYVKDQASPERELGLLEEIAAQAHAAHQLIVTKEEVETVIQQKVGVPLQVEKAEQNTLLNLEAKLHERVIGQNRAIKQVSDALLRARAGLTSANRPVGTFLFLGPTGVGKTETAKALADIYFGSTDKLIRIDMTEYADALALQKLLGTDEVNDPGSLTISIQKNPSAVVLFDEFEKSSVQVKNVLLQLLDEGRLTTNYGKALDFTNTLIVATSNAGSDFIKEQISSGAVIDQFEKQLVDQLITSKVFSPELLNRFDGVIVFSPLSPAEIEQVVGLQLNLLQAQVKKEKGIELVIAPAVMAELAKRGYDPVFGARALERVLKNDLETTIAREIIAQSPQPGSTLQITTL